MPNSSDAQHLPTTLSLSWRPPSAGDGDQSAVGRPWRPSWRRSSRFSPCAAASAACSCSVSARWRCLSSVICAVGARTTLLCDGGCSASRSRRTGGVCWWSARSCSTRARSGERYRKSIETRAVLASRGDGRFPPRACSRTGSKLAISPSCRPPERRTARREARQHSPPHRRMRGWPGGVQKRAFA